MILNYANIFQGGDIEDLQVPVGGDQLTRVRLQGAKALRTNTIQHPNTHTHTLFSHFFLFVYYFQLYYMIKLYFSCFLVHSQYNVIGAKALRNGSLASTDRLEHLNPVIVEMFHTLQDFLEVIYAVNLIYPWPNQSPQSHNDNVWNMKKYFKYY
jgi:hypothetical protein